MRYQKSFIELDRFFANLGIPTKMPAFYNHSAFVSEEAKNPKILEDYAQWVRKRPRSDSYNAMVRKIVPDIMEAVVDQVQRDGQLGVCIDVSMMLSKMFEEHGVWCYGVSGSLTILNQTLDAPTHFWQYDDKVAPGHVWLVAPPFEIVDGTLQTQPYERGEGKLVPKFLLCERGKKIKPTAEEFVAPGKLKQQYQRYGALPNDVHLEMYPELRRTTAIFPSLEVESGQTTLRYAAGGITISDAPSLKDITSRRWNGLLAHELYNRFVKPKLLETQRPRQQ